MNKKVKMQQKEDAYVFEYPEAIAFADAQNSIFWPPTEIKVEKDIQDIRVNNTEAETHAIVTILRLFTLYERFAGKDYWGGRVMRMFPRPCIQTMANCFSFFEINVHARFYNALNEALNLNTPEFYLSYVEDPTLKARMDFIDAAISDPDDLLSLAVFSAVEGCVLYAPFAFLKSFQVNGKNQMTNVVAGVDFSLRDENLHSEGGAWLFKRLLQELLEAGVISSEYVKKLEQKIINAFNKIREHEFRIIDMMFEKGKIDGITDVQLKHFVEHRLNVCMQQLGFNNIYEVKYNPIAKWFYKNINSVNFHDFFVKVGNSYNRNWTAGDFTW